MTITPEQIQQHGLSDSEYQTILKLLGREPNLVELGIFSVMWSEHCSYKSSRKHLKNFPTKAPWVIQGPGENAGVIDIGDGDAIAFKMESHNHPSFIEPYQGAATGVGGIMRDVFTMGARPIANLNCLRFGEPTHEKTSFLVNGVVAGIGGYGNCMGVPTVGGDVDFDASYNGNILVNAMTVGHVKADQIFLGTASGIGNPVIYVGAKTGRDGIHGATMASGSFDEGSEEKRPTVQVGDPFLEKLLLEACLEVMKSGVVVGIQDMGAAGLTSSSFEMASRAGTGIEMDLDQVPQRETQMTAYEMMLSESQERMLMVVEAGKEDVVQKIFHKWDLDAVVVGRVTDTKRMVIRFKNEVVVDLPIDPLAQAAPVYDRPQKKPEYLNELKADVAIQPTNDFMALAKKILALPTVASKRWIYEQYDQSVMTSTVQGPGSDAAIVRIGESKKAVALRAGCNSDYVYLNPFVGAQIAVAECGRNIVCSGAKPLAVTDCLNFGNPENPEIMWQFVEACRGIATACEAFQTPVVSGNVSLYNETNGTSIHPTPMIGMVGLLQNLDHRLDVAFAEENDVILLLGETRDEIGGSAYAKLSTGITEGQCPALDLKAELLLWEAVATLNTQRLLRSAHDVSEGGLLVTLFESSFPRARGFKVEINSELSADRFFFSESQSRILVSLSKHDVPKALPLLKKMSVPFWFLGDVRSGHATVIYNGEKILDETIAAYQAAYDTGFEKVLRF